jgi:hypothetical protein
LDQQGDAAPTDRPLVRLGAVASLVALVGCLWVAVFDGRPWELVRPPTMSELEYQGIALEVPAQRAGLWDFGENEGMFSLRSGSWEHDPVEVFLDVKPREASDEPPAKERCFLVENPLQDFTRQSEGVVAVAPVWTYEERYSTEEVLWIRRCAYFPSALVNTTVTVWTAAEPDWVDAADRVLASVHGVKR